MSERKPRKTSQQRASMGFVLMLLFSTLGVLATAPSASAAVSGSLGLNASHSPLENSWHSSFDGMSFTVEVENKYATSSGNGRTLTWYACEGDVTVSTCKSIYSDTGQFNLANIPGNSVTNFTAPEQWIPGSSSEGIFTIVYAFSQNDQDASDDVLRFNINLTNDFVDVIINTLNDPLQHLSNLAVHNDQQVLNTDTEYVFKATGQSTVCGVCAFSAEFGWQLWDIDETMMLKEAYKTVTTLPAWGGYDPLNINLPAFSFGQQGHYVLKYGLFSSSGNPYGDLNPDNNFATFEIVLNNSIDLRVTDVYPSHSNQGTVFYYGTDRVVAAFENLGNMSVENITVSFNVYNQQFDLEVEDTCDIPLMNPGSAATCEFNMTTTGASRLLRVQMPTIYQNGEDVRMGDNLYSLTADIEVGPLNPSIQTNSNNEIYLTTDDVELVGRSSALASQPLNYTWREGFFVHGYGQVLNKTGDAFGLGHHNISLQMMDPWGNTEFTYLEFDVLNSINISNLPYVQGSAITENEVSYSHEIMLPHLGASYGIGGGKSPLMLLSFEIEDSNGANAGLREMNLDLNLSEILPDEIDLSTVDLRYLSSTNTQLWTYLDGEDGYEFSPEGDHVSVTMTKGGAILVIGVLPDTNVNAVDVEWNQLEAGQISLDWNAVGNTDNPYVGGWNIYKIQGVTGTTVFPDPANGVSEAIWEELTAGNLVDTLDLSARQWLDPEPLETGICASYAIAPVDREGNPNYQRVNITRVNGGAGLLCGDAIPPTTSLEQFDHQWEFTNSTECFDVRNDWSLCYNLTLSWTWPDHEAQGNLSWNLYRVEFAPENVDLKFIQPIASNMEGVPGEQATFVQTGLENDGIRPYRTYYYILTPIDSVGNELMVTDYPSPNIERVHIDDDWWSYNQHIIPPEPEPPEPPLGIPWLQKLNDATELSEFQIAGVVMLATIVLNFILLPLMLKKRKRLKRVLEARKRNSSVADEFDDFFE